MSVLYRFLLQVAVFFIPEGMSNMNASAAIQVLSGLAMPDTGSVVLDGSDVTGRLGKIVKEIAIQEPEA